MKYDILVLLNIQGNKSMVKGQRVARNEKSED